jgi:hypothetical protein
VVVVEVHIPIVVQVSLVALVVVVVINILDHKAVPAAQEINLVKTVHLLR